MESQCIAKTYHEGAFLPQWRIHYGFVRVKELSPQQLQQFGSIWGLWDCWVAASWAQVGLTSFENKWKRPSASGAAEGQQEACRDAAASAEKLRQGKLLDNEPSWGLHPWVRERHLLELLKLVRIGPFWKQAERVNQSWAWEMGVMDRVICNLLSKRGWLWEWRGCY